MTDRILFFASLVAIGGPVVALLYIRHGATSLWVSWVLGLFSALIGGFCIAARLVAPLESDAYQILFFKLTVPPTHIALLGGSVGANVVGFIALVAGLLGITPSTRTHVRFVAAGLLMALPGALGSLWFGSGPVPSLLPAAALILVACCHLTGRQSRLEPSRPRPSDATGEAA